jgi:hypothetical protein
MKIPGFSATRYLTTGACGILGVGAAVLSSTAQDVVLTENNATVRIAPTADAGMYLWEVDGIDHLASQQWYYRVGSAGPEASLGSLIYNGFSQPTPDAATMFWSGAGFDIEVDYNLLGGSIGSGASDIAEAIKVINTDETTLDFNLFLYTDFDLGGTSGGDTASLNYFGNFPTSLAGYDRALQTEGINTAEVTVFEHAARGEVDFFANTVSKLLNGNTDDLASSGVSVGPVGPGDVTFAFQWNLNVGVGSFETITVDKRLDVVPIPEPTSAALGLLGLSLLVHAARRRRV